MNPLKSGPRHGFSFSVVYLKVPVQPPITSGPVTSKDLQKII